MSEQIREQVSAFLDGELPNTETELLLKRLTRDGELRESFGRYTLIGEAVRGTTRGGLITRGFTGRVNLAIDGESIPANEHVPHARGPRWWRPFAGAAVAAGGAGAAGVPLRQRGGGPPPLPPVPPPAPTGVPPPRAPLPARGAASAAPRGSSYTRAAPLPA